MSELERAEEFVAALNEAFGVNAKEQAPSVQFHARCQCANCADRGDTTTLIVMRYEQWLATMPAWLKLGKVKRMGAQRTRTPMLEESWWPDGGASASRVRIDAMELPKHPDEEQPVRCRRCGSTRSFRLATAFPQAVRVARRAGAKSVVPEVVVYL